MKKKSDEETQPLEGLLTLSKKVLNMFLVLNNTNPLSEIDLSPAKYDAFSFYFVQYEQTLSDTWYNVENVNQRIKSVLKDRCQVGPRCFLPVKHEAKQPFPLHIHLTLWIEILNWKAALP